MNPMAAMAMGVFMNKFPGIADLLTKFPNFKSETKDLAIAFAKKLSESEDPEGMLIRVFQDALAVKTHKVTVIESKPLPKSKR